ncbi:bifunctional ornithine acetyltransferase/N-acetylglutamate synthase [Halalkalibacterium halodurans]|uniref:Arginine biosynthesis bifunctional protein ArgJ n=1 Tax=Halalkalibacterium halodurans (strain ATCC BAA-125 / DSM 18197 / FERM 7344 / JCM 9153 / C-125) TaxID=272558 RepID=ARGJ_HALH5|nr:bifunctional ornithine acetyltransferase/N-acetylglutamate synthase [Halalkalibacterium halodurans]Q9K8V3.1 RecName: Full=Arginine biosynthesis bifunctional protein ArgJ; Includes: RecName: Full=Glutamate N-acetyltransferase; AltName: Full=Ornithine acetyltransferase; Short=OATase; AltName: Full=Ornithine transacetylase; Includes: RecName: Full=Amino-acid acetyltransferase; AltName: Full=N-acetylglutamate synthase; Short=AGSase; Contains: RecName: Full=Arginine biosynthesis bifunctional protein
MNVINETANVLKLETGSVTSAKGFSAVGIHTGVKRKRKDLGAIVCEVPASSAAVYTLNKVQAAPLKVTQESIAVEGKLQAMIVNSGIANACTGKRGLDDAYTMRAVGAETFHIPEHYVAVTSTGVIGEFLPMDVITNGIRQLKPEATIEGAHAFNEAILTTDTVEKHTCYQTIVNGKTVTVGGVAKGSGMIHPNMATMLSFVTTDANIDHGHLQGALSAITNETFNRITVDGDTSTNDMVVVMASGLAENEALTPEHPDWANFYKALQLACEDLAKQIARDGEGATKLIEVEVTGAANDQEAGMVAKQIVGSDLVKTAIYGADANWGRIICAIGYSGCEVNQETIDIAIGPIVTLKQSEPTGFSEEEATAYLKEADPVKISVNLHIGNGTGKAWGCDLTYDYVRINAGYRT